MRLILEQKEEINFGNGTFLSRRGDLILINHCKEKEGMIKTSCHKDVQFEDSSFVGMNRQRKITSPKRPCGQELIIEAIKVG